MGQLDDDIDRWLDGDDESDDYEAPEPIQRRKKNTMSRNEEAMTIADVLEMEPGTKQQPAWINGTIRAYVRDGQVKQTTKGTTYVTCNLEDPDTDTSIAFSAFGKKFIPRSGALVDVSGSITRTEYNGQAQMTGGANTTINVVEDGPPSAGNTSSRPENATGGTRTPPGNYRPVEGQRNGAVLGVTVGMAINNASADARSAQIDMENEGAFKLWLWKRASIYLRMSQALERGDLAPAPGEKRQATPPAAAQRDAEAAHKSGFPAEDVPF